jgi:NADPH:quinone reductase-like Zn-dependent oxidoreductase
MKAFYLTSYGGPERAVFGELADPVLESDKLLIQVKAVSINPVDFKIKRGDLKIILGSDFPKILGSDFAGVVKESGSWTKGFKPGDRVYGAVPLYLRKPGAMSELLFAEPKYARLIPAEISFEEAASLPVASLTALNGLRNCHINPGKHVLINGATGGVGHFAIQIAKAKGAVVTATCSALNAELAKKLGADEISGYSRDDLSKIPNKFDAIFDAYGKMEYKEVCRLLKRNGIYASTLFKPTSAFYSIFVRIVYGIKLTSANLRTKPEDYEEIEKLFLDKKLKPVIENIYSLEQAAQAFDLAEKGKPRGKIIINI